MNLDLHTYSTFKLGGKAHMTYNIEIETDIEKINSYSQKLNKPLIIIGEGSNTIFDDTHDKYIIAKMKIKGIKIISENKSNTIIEVCGGEIWDDFVNWSVQNNLSGIEALSAIPGTVGAGPIQNIGAYGTELSDVIISVRVFNCEKNIFEEIDKEECNFSYRDSVFKQNKNKYIITSIKFLLSKDKPKIPEYKDVQDFFKDKAPTLSQIREAIIQIRSSKIPDYKQYPNCGSFFKNPIVSKDILQKIQSTNPNIPFFQIEENSYKLYAGWLIENTDYKSTETEHFYFYPKNKLILIHDGNGTFSEFQGLLSKIIFNIKKDFNVTLEPEPNIY